jgi:hypothetical protein
MILFIWLSLGSERSSQSSASWNLSLPGSSGRADLTVSARHSVQIPSDFPHCLPWGGPPVSVTICAGWLLFGAAGKATVAEPGITGVRSAPGAGCGA